METKEKAAQEKQRRFRRDWDTVNTPLKTQAEIIMESGKVCKSVTVYGGPGYPVDPKLNFERMGKLCRETQEKIRAEKWEAFLKAKKAPDIPKKHTTIGEVKAHFADKSLTHVASGPMKALPGGWYEFVTDAEEMAFPA